MVKVSAPQKYLEPKLFNTSPDGRVSGFIGPAEQRLSSHLEQEVLLF